MIQQNYILQLLKYKQVYQGFVRKQMSNQSSESLKVNYVNRNQPRFTDVQDIQNQKSQRKKAKHQQLDHLYSQNYKPANYAKALQYKNTRSYKKKLPNGQYKQIQTLEDTTVLKYFGLGPYFFIQYMRRIVWLFFVLSLLEGVRIYINIKSNGLAKYTPTFSTYLITTTLGNFAFIAGNYNGKGILSDYDNYIMAIVPGVTFFAFLVFYLLWKAHYNGEIADEEEDNSVVKPQKFCLEVEGLDVEKVDERELERLFSVFGPVFEVSLVRRFKNKLSYFEELDQIEEEIKEEQLQLILGSGDQQNLASLKREKEKLSKFINTLRINPEIISAFIHFQYEKSKVDCLGYYNDHYLFDSGLHTCFREVCCCCVDEVQEKYLYKGRPLKVKNAKVPTPEDINWESYQIGVCGKIVRVVIAILIILVFIFISTSIIALCSIYINTHASDCQGVNVTMQCVNTNTVTCSTTEKVCYCNKNVFTALNDDKMNAYCKSEMNQFFISQGIQYAVVAVSAITNSLFGIVVDKIINFTRPSSYSSGLMGKTIVYTLFLIFNTVFIPILIYSNIYGFKTTDYASLLTIISADLKNALRVNELTFYLDFERVWYSNVSPIFTNFIIMDTIFTWIFFIYNKIMGDKEGLKDDEGTILQKTMNDKITAFRYNLYVEFAYFNLMIFMGVFLSGGMPVMMPLAFLSLISRYITSRSIIQNLSSKIQGLGVDFMSYPFTFLPILIVVGSVFSGWMITANDSLIPPNLTIHIPIELPESVKVNQLIRQLYVPYFLIIALLTLVWFFFENTIVRFFSWLSSLCFEKKQVVHPYHTRPFSEYAKTMNVLASYNIRNNDKMRNVILNLEKYLVVNEDKF